MAFVENSLCASYSIQNEPTILDPLFLSESRWTPKDLAQCSLVCKSWYKMATSDIAWFQAIPGLNNFCEKRNLKKYFYNRIVMSSDHLLKRFSEFKNKQKKINVTKFLCLSCSDKIRKIEITYYENNDTQASPDKIKRYIFTDEFLNSVPKSIEALPPNKQYGINVNISDQNTNESILNQLRRGLHGSDHDHDCYIMTWTAVIVIVAIISLNFLAYFECPGENQITLYPYIHLQPIAAP